MLNGLENSLRAIAESAKNLCIWFVASIPYFVILFAVIFAVVSICLLYTSTDVLDAMLTHEVSGGGVDSYERLGTAVRMSLEKLSAVPAGERVLMLFTDSSPTDEDLERVFCRNETPIRSAVLFVPTAYSGSEYMFRMVDADGKTCLLYTSHFWQ